MEDDADDSVAKKEFSLAEKPPLIMGANTDLNTIGEVAKKDADAFNLDGEILELRESSHKESVP